MLCSIMSTLDANAEKLLRQDPGNPDDSNKAAPGKNPVFSRSTTAPASRVSLKETIAARKKAAEAAAASKEQKAPPRPNSAARVHQDVPRPNSAARIHQPARPASAQSAYGAPSPPRNTASGLASKPMRPGRPVRPKTQQEVSRPTSAGSPRRGEQPKKSNLSSMTNAGVDKDSALMPPPVVSPKHMSRNDPKSIHNGRTPAKTPMKVGPLLSAGRPSPAAQARYVDAAEQHGPPSPLAPALAPSLIDDTPTIEETGLQPRSPEREIEVLADPEDQNDEEFTMVLPSVGQPQKLSEVFAEPPVPRARSRSPESKTPVSTIQCCTITNSL
jgi:hypothetical protein